VDLASLPESALKALEECAFLKDPWGFETGEASPAVLCGGFIATVRKGLGELRRDPNPSMEIIEALTPFDAQELADIQVEEDCVQLTIKHDDVIRARRLLGQSERAKAPAC